MASLIIADDHQMVAECLGLALNAAPDLSVLGVAATVPDAVELAGRQRPDVIVLDQLLPRAGAASAIRQLVDASPGSRVVILTASADEAAVVQAVDAGCAGFVSKTASLDDLVDAVRAAAAGEVLMSSAVLRRLLPRLSTRYRAVGGDLTLREREVLRLVAQGLSTTGIAERLVVSSNTVRNHVQRILAKLEVHSKVEAVAVARREGLLGEE